MWLPNPGWYCSGSVSSNVMIAVLKVGEIDLCQHVPWFGLLS